ncbi:cytochrome b561 [Ectothiorhodospira mobilis]|uniref:Cytochrome b561 n=1 Tax=Ectothiorhodospira mobilis TaxID=195064 RepID=A0A1I4PFF1_ECTMO|nr:cytochrome b/b6 domain-containing protein [Ectothiorhodospira mobilis]SFM26491.1 cytochrome b561 [Ectothiorhodospira mobilis]
MSTDYPTVEVASGLPRHSFALRVLHWLIAVLLVFALIGGFTLGILGQEQLTALVGADLAGTAFMAHKTLGISILLLMLVRLVVRLSQRTPEYAISPTRMQRALGGLVHFLLYVLVIAMPIVGWLGTAAAGAPVNFFTWELPGFLAEDPALAENLFLAHMALGVTIAILIVLHTAAGLYHYRVRQDWVMKRISLFR